MILSDKIILLRKKNNLTQEELAEKLGVSRQSVSKWEMGNSIPDINKIIQLSDVFGVKTDYLLKDEIDDIEYSDDTVEELEAKKTITVEDANDFMSAYEEYSNNVAESISLFIISPVAVLVSQIIALTTNVKSEDFFVIGGIVVLFLTIAFGVYKLIVKANLIEKYDFISIESFNLSYGVKGVVEKKKEEREQKDNKAIAAAIIMYILCVIPVILVSISESEVLQLSSVILLLIIVSVATNILIKKLSVISSYNMLLQVEDYTMKNKKLREKMSGYITAFWLIITAVYLAVSLYTNRWEITWVIFAAGAVLFAAFYFILKSHFNNKMK
ncbi:helix-turn-helix transcriptional regulator [Finegoldia magna]|uniref:helix-turn-helix domain-containing protein n=1 Tax=Finegoldia magna TaxID=1260 RepID=UPI00290C6DE5|nr:helix-turn-helix transcriptional regulator [Finegoldia magna]MDU6880151.1 helix-turn-helix transcriptional regulator [Finegoldia magna]